MRASSRERGKTKRKRSETEGGLAIVLDPPMSDAG